MKTIQDNDLINHTGLIYAKNYYKLLGLIRLGVIYDEK